MGRPGSSGGKMYMRGMDEVMRNFNKEVKAIQDRGTKGLLMCSAYIRRQTETVPPVSPVDYGNLRASYFTVSSKGSLVGTNETFNKIFKGPKASQIQMDYQSTINESRGMANRLALGGMKRFVVFGYGAGYSGFVHEMIGAEFKRSGAEPKWLETHIKGSTRIMLMIIRDQVKVPRSKKGRK